MISGRFIPTISELRTFEAVARLRSISAAADELSCSQPTVTYRIRELEERWSVELFSRSTRTLEWTATTHQFYARIRSLLAEIENISAEIRDAVLHQLNVNVSPSFAAAWLVERLPAFSQLYPEIDVRLTATNRFVDLAREAVDVAVRLVPGNLALAADLSGSPLVQDERLIVLCSPQYATRWSREPDIDDLAQATLLWQQGTDHWNRFFRACRAGSEPRNGPTFNNADLVLRSAIHHQGVCLMRELLAGDALRQGQLVRLFAENIPCDDTYYILYPRRNAEAKKVGNFVRWMQSEIASTIAWIRNA
jgi:LysR family glycine cleavage system transcriptional activator